MARPALKKPMLSLLRHAKQPGVGPRPQLAATGRRQAPIMCDDDHRLPPQRARRGWPRSRTGSAAEPPPPPRPRAGCRDPPHPTPDLLQTARSLRRPPRTSVGCEMPNNLSEANCQTFWKGQGTAAASAEDTVAPHTPQSYKDMIRAKKS